MFILSSLFFLSKQFLGNFSGKNRFQVRFVIQIQLSSLSLQMNCQVRNSKQGSFRIEQGSDVFLACGVKMDDLAS